LDCAAKYRRYFVRGRLRAGDFVIVDDCGKVPGRGHAVRDLVRSPRSPTLCDQSIGCSLPAAVQTGRAGSGNGLTPEAGRPAPGANAEIAIGLTPGKGHGVKDASQLGLHRMCWYPRTRRALVLSALCAEIFNNYVAIGRTLVWTE
jgi:hypothetical protein